MHDSDESLDAEPLVYRRERLLRILAFATLLVFFQAYMIAPLIPRLAAAFHVSVVGVSLIVPAYLLAYGFATLFYGALADRIGRRAIMLSSFVSFVLLTALTALAQSSTQIIVLRLLTGLGASGIVPLTLALVADLFPYQRRGRPLGWIFGAMAGGMAIGSTLGVILEPFVSWRGLFVGVAVVGSCALLATLPYSDLLGDSPGTARQSVAAILRNYGSLLTTARGRRTYAYVLINAVIHSGVFTWLGVYFAQRFGLGTCRCGRRRYSSPSSRSDMT
jgi:MFS family permease